MVNTDVFDRFHFFHFFVNVESSRLDFSDFWEALGRHLDDLRESLEQGGISAAGWLATGTPRI